MEGVHPRLQQQIPPLAPHAAHLAEVPFPGGLLVAELPPAAECAFLAVVHQWGRFGPLQVGLQAQQALLQLPLQGGGEGEALLEQAPPLAGQHQAMGNGGLLLVGEEAGP